MFVNSESDQEIEVCWLITITTPRGFGTIPAVGKKQSVLLDGHIPLATH